MSEDHILNCRQTHLYRVMRHDAIVCWLYDHLVSRKKYTVINEQKTWVEQAKADQKPDIFLPDCNQAVDVGVVQPGPSIPIIKVRLMPTGSAPCQ